MHLVAHLEALRLCAWHAVHAKSMSIPSRSLLGLGEDSMLREHS